jgi:hypothetical protein
VAVFFCQYLKIGRLPPKRRYKWYQSRYNLTDREKTAAPVASLPIITLHSPLPRRLENYAHSHLWREYALLPCFR